MFMFASAFATVSALNIDSFGRDNNQVYFREQHGDGVIGLGPCQFCRYPAGTETKNKMLQDCCEDVK